MDVAMTNAVRTLRQIMEDSEVMEEELPLAVIISQDPERARIVAEQVSEESGRPLHSVTGIQLLELLRGGRTTASVSDQPCMLFVSEFNSFPLANEQEIHNLWQRGGALHSNSWAVISTDPEDVRPANPSLIDRVAQWCDLDE